MKLYNVLIGWDLWIVAESKEAAHNAAKDVVTSMAEPPGELYSYELNKRLNIPARCHDKLPYLTPDVEAPLVAAGVDLDKDDVFVIFDKLKEPHKP